MSDRPLSGLEVIALANAQLNEASNGYRASRLLQVATFLFSAISIFTSGDLAYITTLAAMVSQGLSWLMRIRASRLKAVGDEGRMRGLLLDAFGSTSENIELADFLGNVSTYTTVHAKDYPLEPDYFASKSPVGLRRLLEHLLENAFWVKRQSEMAVKQGLGNLLWFGVAAFAVALVAIPLSPNPQSVIIARVLVVALTFGAALTQINEIIAWRTSLSKIRLIDRRLNPLLNLSDTELKKTRLEALFAVFGDYSVASADMPPVPATVYKRNRLRLNEEWSQRLRALSPQQSSGDAG